MVGPLLVGLLLGGEKEGVRVDKYSPLVPRLPPSVHPVPNHLPPDTHAWRLHANTRNQAKGMLEGVPAVNKRL